MNGSRAVLSAKCMNVSKAAQGQKVRFWAPFVTLLVWLALVAAWGRQARMKAESLPLWTVHTRSAVFDWVRDIVEAALWRTLLFVPVALLMVLLLATVVPLRKHPAWTALLSIGMSIGACAILLAVGWWPSVAALKGYNLVLPAMGAILGASAGVSWVQGPAARRRFLIGSAVVAVGLVACLAWSFSLMLQREPLPLQAPAVSADEKRHIYDLFAEKNPLKLEPGRAVTIRFTERDLNTLLTLGLSVGHTARIARVQLDAERAMLQATSPLSSRFLNITTEGTARFAAGRIDLRAERLRIGRLELPASILRFASPLLARAITEDARVKPVLGLLRSVVLKDSVLTVTYGRGRLPDGFIAGLFHDANTLALDIPGIKTQVQNLVAGAREMPQDKEARLAAALQRAFRFARQRSTAQRAVAENRSALLALAIVLGHPRVESLVGDFIDEPTRAAAKREFEGTTLRHREDWTKHFFVSAALTIVSAGRLSNATGLFKEEKDSGGGTGFSFGDLLADRAGTTFAEFATHSDASARALQDRILQGFKVDDYFPQPDGLPENLQDAEFRARYGGVGGKGYLELKAEIERRIANCAAYKAS